MVLVQPTQAWGMPPSPAGHVLGNTSGLGGAVPAEIAATRFHLAAFLCGAAWAWAHGLAVWAALDLLLPITAVVLPAVLQILCDVVLSSSPLVAPAVIYITFPILLGLWIALRLTMACHGCVRAWQSRSFSSLAEFRAVQKSWTILGFVALALFVVFIIFVMTGSGGGAVGGT